MSRRSRRKASGRVYTALAVLGVLVWAWQTHPMWLVLGTVLAAVAAGAGLYLRRARLRRPGERTWLYRHYSHDGRLLYVGITSDYPRRCAEHARTSAWWEFADRSRSTCEALPSLAAARAAELAAIRRERPLFNGTGNGRTRRRLAEAG
jgi:predicted GIY-YIG superfamily endonuclease